MNRAASSAWAVLSTIGAYLSSGAKQVGRGLSLVPPWLAHTLWLLSQKFTDLAREGYSENAAVYAVLRFLCTAAAEPPMLAYQRQADGGFDKKKPLDYRHALRQLILHPNPYLTEFEHYELITLHLGITGRYVAWKERSILGYTKAIWPLRPDRVGPIYGDVSKGEPLLLGWSYLVPGTAQYAAIPADEAIFVNFPDPLGQSGGLVEGLGPLQALAIEVGADLEASRFVGNMVANYAQPGLVLKVKRGITSIDDAKLLKAGFIEQFGGRRRGEPMIIDQDSEITPTGFTLSELEFPSLRRVSESRIAGAFGVPAILAGLLVGLEASSTNATLDELRAMFSETTLTHYWRRYETAFTEQLAPEYGDDLVCAFDLTKVRAFAGQALAQIDRVATAYSSGALTIDEYREALGFDPLPNKAGQVLATGIAQGRGVEAYITPAQTTEVEQTPETAPETAPEQSTATDQRAGAQTPEPAAA